MSTVSFVQANGVAQTSPQGPGAIAVSQAFASANASGDTIIVFGFLNANTWAPELSGLTVTDTQGNTYTQIFFDYPGYTQVMCAAWIAQNIKAGANTVKMSLTATAGTQFYLGILIAEYAGMSSGVVHSAAYQAGQGLIANTPITLSVTAASGGTVTDKFIGSQPNPGNGLGGDQVGAYAIDLVVSGTDIRICAAMEQVMTGITDSGGLSFAARFTTSSVLTGWDYGGYLQLWDAAPYTVGSGSPTPPPPPLPPPPPAPFQLHNIRVRQRVVGEYIDGTINEYWESPEFSVEPGRVGELKDFLLDYDTSAAGGQLLIYSDLPNHQLQVARSLPIPYFEGTRAPFVFALEDSSDTLPYGQLFKVRILPPPAGVIRLHGRAVFRARLIGTFFDGSKGEIWETQPLDLLGGTGLFREVAIVAQCGGLMTCYCEFELPEEQVKTRATFTFDTTQSGAYAGREPIYFRMPGNTKGKLQKFGISGAYWARLFELRVYARGLGNTAAPWNWINVPLPPTSDEFAQIQMPVRATPEAFTWIDIPVDPIG